jgi:hypothetical protein
MQDTLMVEVQRVITKLPDWLAEQPALRQRLQEALAGLPPRPSRMSFEEFMVWLDEDTCAEWVNGEVVMTSLIFRTPMRRWRAVA